MSIGIFTDKAHQPTLDEVFAAVGPKRPAWEALTQFVADNYRVPGEWKFYGKNYGWAMRFRRGSQALLSLYPGQNGFTAQIVLSEPLVEHALILKFGKNVRQTIASAREYPEGRWLFIQVRSSKDVQDVQQLLALKSHTPKR